jgi:hypothetical protein
MDRSVKNARKSSYSGSNGGACTVVAECRDGVAVLDSKLGDDSPVLRFTPEAWRALVANVKAS